MCMDCKAYMDRVYSPVFDPNRDLFPSRMVQNPTKPAALHQGSTLRTTGRTNTTRITTRSF